jgi:hypothetical protein
MALVLQGVGIACFTLNMAVSLFAFHITWGNVYNYS